jgi:hypothetical protein
MANYRTLRNNSLLATLPLVVAIMALLSLTASPMLAQDSEDKDKGFDVQSSLGDMHLGNDADSRQVGLPVYPGARVRKHDENRSTANLSLFTYAFGVKLLVLNYDSDDGPSKIIAYYREKLKKYGKVLECRTSEHDGNAKAEESHDSQASKQPKCEGDQGGDIVELKVGTEDNQHLVSVAPAEHEGKGSIFALVYIHSRGKQGVI